MGLPFSDTTNRTGIIQLIEDRTVTQSATGSSYTLATKTRDVNLAFAKFQAIAVDASGRWQVDDTNQVDYPISSTDLVSGQQDYSFVGDGSTPANQVLDIHRVEILDANGVWKLLKSIDMKDIDVALDEFMPTDGEPAFYDKTSNAIMLYPAPSYSQTLGVKFYFSRTPSYFVATGDDTKEAGIPDMFHEYLVLRPSYLYCMQKGMTAKANAYKVEMLEMEEMIRKYYGSRQRDEDPRMTVNNSSAIDRGYFDNRGGTNHGSNNNVDWR